MSAFVDSLVECVFSASGAKTVRYGFDCAFSSSANGFVGGGDSSRGLAGALVEKGRRADRIDDIGGLGLVSDCVGACSDNKELQSLVSGSNSHENSDLHKPAQLLVTQSRCFFRTV